MTACIRYEVKPLTIAELQALHVGDWLWVIDRFSEYSVERTYYAQILFNPITDIAAVLGSDEQHCSCYSIEDYGIKWFAYKNKEQAEIPETFSIAKHVGQNLKVVRVENGFTQKQVADDLGIPVSTYANFEQGRNELNYDFLVVLRAYFGLDLNKLFALPDGVAVVKAV